MKLIKKSLAGVGAALLLASSAQAAIITDWTYTLSAVWSAYAPAGPPPGGVLNPDPLTLTWGIPATGAGQSSLVIGNLAPGLPVQTYIGGGIPPPAFTAPGSSITHTNNPIFAPSLTSATLTATLDLQAQLPANIGGPGILPSLAYNIGFTETPNGGTCADPLSPTPCNDIFVQLTGLLNQSFSYDSDGAGGDPAVTYFANIFPITGGVLSLYGAGDPSKPASVCTAVFGAPVPCIAFTTPEGAATTLQFGFTISTEPLSIPEPGSLALLGAALAAAGGLRRMRKT